MMPKQPSAESDQVKRTHDELYLRTDRKSEPKEYFKFVDAQVRQHLDLDGKVLVDIGCATGDFLYFLGQSHPGARLHGLDVMPSLIEKARTEVPSAGFSVLDISKPIGKAAEPRFDVAFMLGVHSIFDHLTWLTNALSLIRQGGHFFCFGLFNPFDVDVFVKARKSGSDVLEPGWNVMSCASIHAHLASSGQTGTFVPWQIGIPVMPDPADPYRSWTVQQADGTYEIRNGLQVVHTFHLLHVLKV